MAGRGASCFGRGAPRHEGGGGGVGDGGGAPCWVLLPPGLGRLGPNVIEDVQRDLARTAVMAPGVGWGSGLFAGCGRGALTGLGGFLAAVLGFGWVAGGGLAGASALAAAGLHVVKTGLGGLFGRFPPWLGGWSAG